MSCQRAGLSTARATNCRRICTPARPVLYHVCAAAAGITCDVSDTDMQPIHFCPTYGSRDRWFVFYYSAVGVRVSVCRLCVCLKPTCMFESRKDMDMLVDRFSIMNLSRFNVFLSCEPRTACRVTSPELSCGPTNH